MEAVLEKQHFCEILPDPFHQGLPSSKATLLKREKCGVAVNNVDMHREKQGVSQRDSIKMPFHIDTEETLSLKTCLMNI